MSDIELNLMPLLRNIQEILQRIEIELKKNKTSINYGIKLEKE
ncbi:unnamed protein product [marine sediment metagenome]|uniref:Uncharacterized protein n=1 Tax=marine sediment metagenome TaxID=412755 RepID=X1CQ80_9ZZZZ